MNYDGLNRTHPVSILGKKVPLLCILQMFSDFRQIKNGFIKEHNFFIVCVLAITCTWFKVELKLFFGGGRGIFCHSQSPEFSCEILSTRIYAHSGKSKI